MQKSGVRTKPSNSFRTAAIGFLVGALLCSAASAADVAATQRGGRHTDILAGIKLLSGLAVLVTYVEVVSAGIQVERSFRAGTRALCRSKQREPITTSPQLATVKSECAHRTRKHRTKTPVSRKVRPLPGDMLTVSRADTVLP
jgi:hypothetical protein